MNSGLRRPTPVPGTSALGQRLPIGIQVVKSVLTMATELDFTVRGRNGVEWSGSGTTPNDGIYAVPGVGYSHTCGHGRDCSGGRSIWRECTVAGRSGGRGGGGNGAPPRDSSVRAAANQRKR